MLFKVFQWKTYILYFKIKKTKKRNNILKFESYLQQNEKNENVDDISMCKKIIDIFLVSSDIIGKINE